MNAKDVLLTVMATNDMVIEQYLNDLSDADLLLRPVAGQNHIAWQLGHLISAERSMLEDVKPGVSPALPEGFAEAHSKEASTVDEPSKFHPKQRYLELYKAQREASRKVIRELSEAELDAPSPERMRQFVPRVGDYLTLLADHPMMHAGQFVSVRRMLKKPVTM